MGIPRPKVMQEPYKRKRDKERLTTENFCSEANPTAITAMLREMQNDIRKRGIYFKATWVGFLRFTISVIEKLGANISIYVVALHDGFAVGLEVRNSDALSS
jgi:hypothetical protein